MPNPKLSFRVSPEVLEQLQEQATKESRTVSEIANEALLKGLGVSVPRVGTGGDKLRELEVRIASLEDQIKPKSVKPVPRVETSGDKPVPRVETDGDRSPPACPSCHSTDVIWFGKGKLLKNGGRNRRAQCNECQKTWTIPSSSGV